jgi:heme exporter protein C
VNKWLVAGLILALVHAAWFFMIGDVSTFMRPHLVRIVLFHLPCAWACSVLVLGMAGLGIKYLRSKNPLDGYRLEALSEIALLYGVLTLATGIIFSRSQWNAWWQWDPRQTSFLMVVLILAAGQALRAGFSESFKRAQVMSAYAIGNVIPFVFLTYVFPRLPQTSTFHPKAPSFGWDYRAGIYLGTVVLVLIAVGLVADRVRVLKMEDDPDGSDDLASGNTAGAGVVEPVALPPQ